MSPNTDSTFKAQSAPAGDKAESLPMSRQQRREAERAYIRLRTGQKPNHKEIKKMPATIKLERDPNDSWAEVELWRWQYGSLPASDDMRPLDISKGLEGMAEAIQKGDPKNFPSPMNVVSVLRYAAKHIK